LQTTPAAFVLWGGDIIKGKKSSDAKVQYVPTRPSPRQAQIVEARHQAGDRDLALELGEVRPRQKCGPPPKAR